MAHVFILASLADSLLNFRGPLLRELVGRGHTVSAAAPGPSGAVRRELARMGVRCHDVPLARTGTNPVADLGTLRHLVRLFRAERPDLFLGYTIKPVIYGSLAAHRAGVPAAYAMVTGLGYGFARGGRRSRLLGWLVPSLYRKALRRNRKVFFQNPDDLAVFRDRGLLRDPGQAVLVSGSGVDLEAFAPAPLPERVSFLLIARLLGAKGVREYAEAAAIVRERHPEVRFRLVGWIDDNPDAIAERELAAWTADGRIEFLGRLEDVRPAIADAAVYVLPSYREGTPRTVLEAMAMGRPVITTDAPGCRETVTDGENGRLVPVGDAKALAEAMEWFILHPDRAALMGKASHERAVERYDVTKVNRVILQAMGLA